MSSSIDTSHLRRNRMLVLSLREPTWHATKPKFCPRIVSIMGPKRLPQYFATPTHKLRRGLPPGQSVCPILGAPQKRPLFSAGPNWPLQQVRYGLQSSRHFSSAYQIAGNWVTGDLVSSSVSYLLQRTSLGLPGKVIAVSPPRGRSKKANTLGLKK